MAGAGAGPVEPEPSFRLSEAESCIMERDLGAERLWEPPRGALPGATEARWARNVAGVCRAGRRSPNVWGPLPGCGVPPANDCLTEWTQESVTRDRQSRCIHAIGGGRRSQCPVVRLEGGEGCHKSR